VPHLPQDERAIFCRLFRPELLQHIKKMKLLPALSSDALSGWGVRDAARHNANVRAATKLVLSRAIELADHITYRRMTDLFQAANVFRNFRAYCETVEPLQSSELVALNKLEEHYKSRSHVVQDGKLVWAHASTLLKRQKPPLYGLPRAYSNRFLLIIL